MSKIIGLPEKEVENKLKEIDAILKDHGARIEKRYTIHGLGKNGGLIAESADITIVFVQDK